MKDAVKGFCFTILAFLSAVAAMYFLGLDFFWGEKYRLLDYAGRDIFFQIGNVVVNPPDCYFAIYLDGWYGFGFVPRFFDNLIIRYLSSFWFFLWIGRGIPYTIHSIEMFVSQIFSELKNDE